MTSFLATVWCAVVREGEFDPRTRAIEAERDRYRDALVRIVEDEIAGRCPMWWTLPELVPEDAQWVRTDAETVVDGVLRVACDALDRPCPLDAVRPDTGSVT